MMARHLFIKKEIDPTHLNNSSLEKNLTAFHLTAMGVGAVVGAGIFITPGIIAAKYAGPGAMLSYLLAAVVCALAALCYSEFASTIPLAGSAYTYVYTIFGELAAWVLGWALISEYLFAVSSVAVSWSAYFQNLLAGFNLHLPAFLSTAYESGKGGGVNLIAGLITMLIGLLLVNGLKESTRINTIMVGVKLVVILLFLGVAIFYVKPANFHPFLPYGSSGILSGAALAFYAYIGFDAVSTASEEVINPQKAMPIGIIASLAIASILYAAVATVLVGVVPYHQLNVGDPVAFTLNLINQNWIAGIISLGAVAGMTTVLLVMSYGGTRLIFAISRDGLLPATLSKVSPSKHVPVTNTFIFTSIASLCAMLVPLDKIAELVNIGTLFAFATVSLGVVFLRKLPNYKQLPKGFNVPLYPFIPLLSFTLCLLLMTQLQKITWLVFLLWTLIGLGIYFSYGYRHSQQRVLN